MNRRLPLGEGEPSRDATTASNRWIFGAPQRRGGSSRRVATRIGFLQHALVALHFSQPTSADDSIRPSAGLSRDLLACWCARGSPVTPKRCTDHRGDESLCGV